METKETFTHCNKCPHKVTSKITSSQSVNWYCGKVPDMYTATKNKNISYLVRDGELVPSPNWCPLKEKSDKPYSVETRQKSTTYFESWEAKRKLWDKLPHTSSWDDIKVNEIYHVPPINGEKRMDIMITAKTQYSISYKTITQDGSAYTTHSSFFKTSPQVNFLVKHKLIQFKNKN